MSDTTSVSQSIPSHEDGTSSNSSPNTGPNTPDDISRWLCHIDLQSFGKGLQAAARAVFPNTSKSRYTKVSVLTLCWEDEDPNLPVSIEIEKLKSVFRDMYGFETELWKIPDRNCLSRLFDVHARLSNELILSLIVWHLERETHYLTGFSVGT